MVRTEEPRVVSKRVCELCGPSIPNPGVVVQIQDTQPCIIMSVTFVCMHACMQDAPASPLRVMGRARSVSAQVSAPRFAFCGE